MVAILPSPQESSKWLFKRHGDNLRYIKNNKLKNNFFKKNIFFYSRYIHGHTEEDQIELFQEYNIIISININIVYLIDFLFSFLILIEI